MQNPHGVIELPVGLVSGEPGTLKFHMVLWTLVSYDSRLHALSLAQCVSQVIRLYLLLNVHQMFIKDLPIFGIFLSYILSH